jgi:hypothetical protein
VDDVVAVVVAVVALVDPVVPGMMWRGYNGCEMQSSAENGEMKGGDEGRVGRHAARWLVRPLSYSVQSATPFGFGMDSRDFFQHFHALFPRLFGFPPRA